LSGQTLETRLIVETAIDPSQIADSH